LNLSWWIKDKDSHYYVIICYLYFRSICLILKNYEFTDMVFVLQVQVAML